MKNELKRVQQALSADYPTEEVNSEGEEQRGIFEDHSQHPEENGAGRAD